VAPESLDGPPEGTLVRRSAAIGGPDAAAAAPESLDGPPEGTPAAGDASPRAAPHEQRRKGQVPERAVGADDQPPLARPLPGRGGDQQPVELAGPGAVVPARIGAGAAERIHLLAQFPPPHADRIGAELRPAPLCGHHQENGPVRLLLTRSGFQD